ncbi:hypothetical protein AXX17_AT1G73130 [Arabidopsis thaliana]|nr:hypothetical protein AXX17_AT1G73130 [Arabidopsis thaliana]
MFCTALNYICLRILREGPDEGREYACKLTSKMPWIVTFLLIYNNESCFPSI